MNTSINNPTNQPKPSMSEGEACAMPRRMPRRSLLGDGTAMASIRQKSFRAVSGLFQMTSTVDDAATTVDSKTPLNRSFSFRRGCSLRKLAIEEHLDDSGSSHTLLSTSGASSSMDSPAKGTSRDQQTPPSTRQPPRHRRRPKRSTSSPMTRRSSAKSSMDELEELTKELERMARALDKVEDPDKILLRHMKKEPVHSLAA